ncbi:MAG: elongation factor P maturation arginine rhamnosyltransferase EarP [Burkholderiales bacterium]|nr:elongation factor P maturation arginine rhamnosyltransferase EarP [Burkholderiales bacterium]
MNTRKRWDIFCTVVDNYGDIGVCWRLARQLAAEHGLSVRLWVDDLASFAQLAPQLDPQQDQQQLNNVEIQRWRTPFAETIPAEVVIEAFACQLPETYIAAMAAQATQPVWINLEYLSAEDWVEDHHSLASPHPRLPLTKYFYFPGFSLKTGGLIREAGLIAQRDAFQHGAHTEWWHGLGAVPAPNALKVSLFAYPTAPVAPLLQAWIQSVTPVYCALPETPLAAAIAQALDVGPIYAGTRIVRGNLTLVGIPFLTQELYDQLLWTCDLNFVRGEDSFVRALWAAKPLVWQIYPQHDAAHEAKLEAFLARYTPEGRLRADAPDLAGLWRAWNGRGDPAHAWPAFAAALPDLAAHARQWAVAQSRLPDLAANLVKFSQNPL